MLRRQKSKIENQPMKNNALTAKERELQQKALSGDPIARVDLRHYVAMMQGGSKSRRGGALLKNLPGQLDGGGYSKCDPGIRF